LPWLSARTQNKKTNNGVSLQQPIGLKKGQIGEY
jgi:hypothetical protein